MRPRPLQPMPPRRRQRRRSQRPIDFDKVSALINDAIAANELPGAVVVIGHGGKVVFHQAYGVRKLDGEPGLNAGPAPAEPMTEDTIFDIASLTKPVGDGACRHAAVRTGQGRSSTIRCRSICRSSTPRTIRSAHRVTVRMLLTHTSGEPGDVELGDPWGLAETRQGRGHSIVR